MEKEEYRPWGIAFITGAIFFGIGIYSLTIEEIGLIIPIIMLYVGFISFIVAFALSGDPPSLEDRLDGQMPILLSEETKLNCMYSMMYIGINSVEDENGIPCIDWYLMTDILKRKGYSSAYIMATFRTLQVLRKARLKDKVVYFTLDEETNYLYLNTVGKVPVLNRNNIV